MAFGLGGRTNAFDFGGIVLTCGVVALAGVVLHLPARQPLAALCGGLGLLAVVMVVTARRLHDFDMRGRWPVAFLGVVAALWVLQASLGHDAPAVVGHVALWAAVLGTLAAVGMLLAIGSAPPTAGPNRFGPPPPGTPDAFLEPPKPSETALALHRRILADARPALRLAPAEGPAASGLGGKPHLDPDIPWPASPRGDVLSFIAQLDLAEVRAGGGPVWLPADGLLLIFALAEGWDVDGWAVIRQSAPAAEAREAPRQARVFPSAPVAYRQVTSYPSLDWLGLDIRRLHLTEAELDSLSDGSRTEAPGPDHRIDGYPDEIQGEPMALMCERRSAEYPLGEDVEAGQVEAARHWRLLLQVDSDERLKMNWGDGGRLYFFVREEAAAAGDFSGVWMITDCY